MSTSKMESKIQGGARELARVRNSLLVDSSADDFADNFCGLDEFSMDYYHGHDFDDLLRALQKNTTLIS